MDLSTDAPLDDAGSMASAALALTTDGEVIFSGALQKMKEGKNWKARHCSIVLGEEGPRLVYRAKDGAKAKGVLPLKGAWVGLGEFPAGSKTAFQVMPSRHGDKTYYFQAASEEDRATWLEQLSQLRCLNAPLETDRLVTGDIDATSLSRPALLANVCEMAATLQLGKLLDKSDADLRAYFEACCAQMNDVPFHNFNHVADVTQFLFYMLRSTGLATLLSPMQLVAAFLAAIAHDLDHRGKSNAYELNEKTDIGVKYPAAPLETHHAASAIATLDSSGILSGLSAESAAEVRECVHSCIMSTDMSRHKAIIEEFKSAESELMSDKHTASDFFSHGPKGMLLLGMCLKLADVSNVARPVPTADNWSKLVYEEFYAEGDADKAAGREVNPLHNKEENNIPKSQVGFINFLVLPVAQELFKFLEAASLGPDAPGADPEGFGRIVESLSANAKSYGERAAA